MLLLHVISCLAHAEYYRSAYLDGLWGDGRALEHQLGNMLSLYWHHRALALFSGLDFHLQPPSEQAAARSWLSRLDTNVSSTASPAQSAAIGLAETAAMHTAAMACKGRDRGAPHRCTGTWTHPQMHRIIHT